VDIFAHYLSNLTYAILSVDKMKRRILAIDMGGTSVKAGVFVEGNLEKTTKWEHTYNDCSLNKAKKDLIDKIKAFYNYRIDAIGIGVAGLIAKDNSLYRSTVLRSFNGFNIPGLLKHELGVGIVTIDNDADCGAISEWNYAHKPLLYVVVGSGIGSAYIDSRGNLPYLTRFDSENKFMDKDNPIPNDLGLRIAVPRRYVSEKIEEKLLDELASYDLPERYIDEIIRNEKCNQLEGLNNDPSSIKVSALGSALGFKKIDSIILELVEKRVDREKTRVLAYKIFGHFLGYGIAKTQKLICEEQHLKEYPFVVLSGPIMNSYAHFGVAIDKALNEQGVKCEIKISDDLESSNLKGAYLRTAKELDRMELKW